MERWLVRWRWSLFTENMWWIFLQHDQHDQTLTTKDWRTDVKEKKRNEKTIFLKANMRRGGTRCWWLTMMIYHSSKAVRTMGRMQSTVVKKTKIVNWVNTAWDHRQARQEEQRKPVIFIPHRCCCCFIQVHCLIQNYDKKLNEIGAELKLCILCARGGEILEL